MTREMIEDFRKIVKPYMAKQLNLLNFENMGEQDKAEFERDFDEILDMAIKSLQAEPCEDCISRQAAIDSINGVLADYIPFFYGRYKQIPLKIASAIMKLPPVNPQEPIIRTGDVIKQGDIEVVVTWCDGKDWNGFLLKGEGVGEVGQVYSCMSCKGWKKTGLHFPEISEVLIQGGNKA